MRKQHYFSVPTSVHLSVAYLHLNHLVEFHQTCYITPFVVRVCESNIIFPYVRPCVRRPHSGPSRYLFLNHRAGGGGVGGGEGTRGIQPNLLHHLSSWRGGCARSLFRIYLSSLLLYDLYYPCRVRQKSTFEHVQNWWIQIVLHMRICAKTCFRMARPLWLFGALSASLDYLEIEYS